MVFRFYPEDVRGQMHALRDLVFETAAGLGLSDDLQETLKWGEPSYHCRGGSAIRMDWKPSAADGDACKLLFHCQTSLVATFRELYPDDFSFEDKRAIRFARDEKLNAKRLSHCIELALRYHSIKHLPLLGAEPR